MSLRDCVQPRDFPNSRRHCTQISPVVGTRPLVLSRRAEQWVIAAAGNLLMAPPRRRSQQFVGCRNVFQGLLVQSPYTAKSV